MTTTTGDPSTLKTPASLSGGDLVSRLLAATPPYLYNVPLTPHSFFFSEMLRSFVQAKTEASTTGSTVNTARRRKRSWREARDRPLELTTKEKHLHYHQQQHQQKEKYLHAQQQQQQQQQQPSPQETTRLESRNKPSDGYDSESKVSGYNQNPGFGSDILKPIDENKPDFAKQPKSFFDERHSHFEQTQSPDEIFPADVHKVKPEESHPASGKNCTYNGERAPAYEDRTKGVVSNSELPLLPDQKKLDFSRNFLPGLPGRSCDMLQGVKGFGLPGNVTNPEFLPGPLWYPPYPMPQSYPGIDPLHFFIDLRVSGHIWDRKLSERQLPFKGKHCSAFSVPPSKEYSNRPLNLTRDEASTSRITEENLHGTNYILKHLTRTYKEIQEVKTISRTEEVMSGVESEDGSKEVSESERSSKSQEPSTSSTNEEEERKDLRALIGLELVVDYVKEPKGEAANQQTSQVTE